MKKPPITVVIRTCRNPRCKARFEQAPMQSKDFCEYCRPVKNCIHNIKITEVCQSCMSLYGSRFQRAM